MATGKALNGKPYAGNPHVRFDEGEVAPAATPRRGSLLYTTDKNNFCYPGATAPGFKIAAQLRGEKEDVVFTSCLCCFPKNL